MKLAKPERDLLRRINAEHSLVLAGKDGEERKIADQLRDRGLLRSIAHGDGALSTFVLTGDGLYAVQRLPYEAIR